MNIRTHGFTAIAVALLILSVMISAQADPASQKAIAITQTSLSYLNLNAPGGIESVAITGAKTLTGVAVYNNRIAFIADSSTNTIHVVDLFNPRNNQKTIDLTNEYGTLVVNKPTSVAIDAAGGVYVVGSKWEDTQSQAHYAYAYLSSNDWSDFGNAVNVSLTELESSPMVDVAASGTTGVILQQYIGADSAGAGVSYVREVNGLTPGSANPLGTNNYYPRAITASKNPSGSQFAYIVNKWIDDNGLYTSSLCTYNLAGGINTAILPGHIAPDDIAWFSSGGKNYLGIVGNEGGKNKAWKFELDTSGFPIVTGSTEYILDASSQHQCAVSENGETFWISNPLAGTVQTLDTSTWTQLTEGRYSGLDRVQSVATIPEPSSLTMLITLSTGMLAMVRRRRR